MDNKKTENSINRQVDILMATYNTNIEFLRIQLDSLLEQTHLNIKIIISDDA